MTKQKQANNWDFEVLNPIETKKVVGGNWDGYIEEVTIWGYSNNGSGGYNGPAWTFGHGGQNDSGSNYQGGGGNGDNNSSTYTSSFPDHICKQGENANTCAPNALSYVAKHFGASGLTASDFAEMVGKDFFNMAFNNATGLTAGELGNIVANVFDYNIIGMQISDIIYATNSGNPIIANFVNPGENDGHTVVITGADANGTVCFMDSMTGNMRSGNINDLNFIGNFIQITGIKDTPLVNLYKNDANDLSVCSICGG